jgi:methyl-accepting chemotaxis protein
MTVWETTRNGREVNITDAAYAIADALESVSKSIDEVAAYTSTERVADALENISTSVEAGLKEIADGMGG